MLFGVKVPIFFFLTSNAFRRYIADNSTDGSLRLQEDNGKSAVVEAGKIERTDQSGWLVDTCT